MKSTRKNRFRQDKALRLALIRKRAVFTVGVLLKTLALAATSGAFIFIYDYFTQSPYFQARQIEVTGCQRFDRREVLAIAGIDTQTNILALNLTTTRKRLLADPWIAAVTIHREIPSGLKIHIREESPLALLDMGNGRGFLINTEGRVFKREDGSEESALPRIQGLNPADLPVAGRPLTEALRAVMTLLHLARGTDTSFPFAGFRRLWMDREIGATIYTAENDRSVKLGFGQYRDKCVLLRHLMARLNQDSRLSNCQVIDLFDVNRIVITPAPPGSDRGEV